VWDKVLDNRLNPKDVELLHPVMYKIEDQNVFKQSLNMDDYYYTHDIINEWQLPLLENHLCALESLKRVSSLMLSSGKTYDYVMFIRPDAKITNALPIGQILDHFSLLKKTIILPNFDHFEGYNDRFAMMRYGDVTAYSHRIDNIKEYRKEHGRIVSEKYCKYSIDKCYDDVKFIDFKFELVRSNRSQKMPPKVYIKIPAHAVVGGVESLYQLADAINNNGGESVVLWNSPDAADPIPPKYKHYNIKYSTFVEDVPSNWIIYPEIWTDQIDTYSNMKKGIWWLSVDNNQGKFQDFFNPNITHFYQSFYALNFLQKNGVEKYLPLFDYVPEAYTQSTYDISQKRDIVCYNPAKGLEITSHLKAINPDINFVPIVGMNELEVINILKVSKVYIDIGHHPGRDRIPRESAVLGNCVITNLMGSAGFYNDIPIDKRYKNTNIGEIGNLIRTCFENFECVIDDYSLYRSSIKNQKEQLNNLVKQYFI
jgi:hypothetical protein